MHAEVDVAAFVCQGGGWRIEGRGVGGRIPAEDDRDQEQDVDQQRGAAAAAHEQCRKRQNRWDRGEDMYEDRGGGGQGAHENAANADVASRQAEDGNHQGCRGHHRDFSLAGVAPEAIAGADDGGGEHGNTA